MTETVKKIEFKVERTIPAAPDEVYDGWLDPTVPGNPWNASDRFLLSAKVDGLFYLNMRGTAHYGRFTAIERPRQLQHTWISPNTLGYESTVTVTFDKHGEGTRMTLVHSGLPDDDKGRSHEKGWSYFLGLFLERFERLHASEAERVAQA